MSNLSVDFEAPYLEICVFEGHSHSVLIKSHLLFIMHTQHDTLHHCCFHTITFEVTRLNLECLNYLARLQVELPHVSRIQNGLYSDLLRSAWSLDNYPSSSVFN